MFRHLFLFVVLAASLQSSGCNRPNVNFPRVHRDRIVVWAMMEEIDELFFQNLSGQPAGQQDVTGDCPLGGQVQITGDLTSADGTSCDLLFDLSDCKFQATSTSMISAELTLTGRVSLMRDLSGAELFGNIDYASDDLRIRGDVEAVPDEASIDHECGMSATIVRSADVGAVAGELCTRPVTWIYYQSSCGF